MKDLFGLEDQTVSTARFSPCRQYRYDLWRRWREGPYAMFIGLNPSTADETQDDPTIRKCINFAKSWGFAALCMTNLFAFRATQPSVMKAHPSPIGEDNDATLIHWAEGAGIVIAAWGMDGPHLDRDAEVMQLIPNLKCLGLSKDGHPRHPLYLRGDSLPIAFGNHLKEADSSPIALIPPENRPTQDTARLLEAVMLGRVR